jgi:hypothetical protein
MVDCKISKLRFRADQVFWSAVCDMEGNVLTYVSVLESENMEQEAINKALKKAKSLGYIGQLRPLQLKDLTKAPLEIYHLIPSPSTGEQGHLTLPRDFNLMFETNVGAIESETSTAYLRPETAQVLHVLIANSFNFCLGHIYKFSCCSENRKKKGIDTPQHYGFHLLLNICRFPLVLRRLEKHSEMRSPQEISFFVRENLSRWK